MNILAQEHSLEKTIQYWKLLSPILHNPRNEDEYEQLASILDKLLDIVGENESHELIGLVDFISYLIAMYDASENPLPEGKGVDALKFLMEQHNLSQSDLSAELGSQGVVSEILNGKRQLNLSHIKKLAKRFHVSPTTFID